MNEFTVLVLDCRDAFLEGLLMSRVLFRANFGVPLIIAPTLGDDLENEEGFGDAAEVLCIRGEGLKAGNAETEVLGE